MAKKRKKKKTETDMLQWLGEKAACTYVFLMLAIFPSFYTDRLFNLHMDKMYFFLCISALFFCAMVPLAVKTVRRWWDAAKIPALKKPDTVFALILLAAVIFSTILALDSSRSFLRMEDRTVSGLCFLFCVVVFFLVRAYCPFRKAVQGAWMGGSCAIYLFGILCACGINFLYIQDGLTEAQAQIYYTPLGNTNFNTCFVCLMLFPVLGIYMGEMERNWRIFCGINIYMGVLFMFFIKTDSAAVAVPAGLVALVYFAAEKEEWFDRYVQIIALYLGAKVTICVLLALFGGHIYPFNGLGKLLVSAPILLGEAAVYVLFLLLWRWRKDKVRAFICRIRNYVLGLGIVAALCGVACIAYANLRSADIPAGSFLQRLVVTDSTFSGRGFVWIRAIKALKEEPFWRMLLGNGLNCFKLFLGDACYEPVSGVTFADPHNEILQMFSDMGLLGLVGYFGLLGATLFRALRGRKDNVLLAASAVTLAVYLVQALANEYSIFHLPLLFIFLALVNGDIGKNQ